MLKQSTARNLMVLMTSSTDHITGATGLTLTITASKDGAAFASIAPTVTERGDGWYSLALTTAHTDTLGDFVLHVTASGADPTDVREEVFAALPGDSVTVSSLANNVITAASIAADAVTEIQSGLATASDLTTTDTKVTAIKAKTDSLAFTVAGQVDANIQYVNDIQVKGTGTTADPWNPV
jgi:hypothetical protein